MVLRGAEGALRVPVWPTRFVILLGGALAILNYAVAAMIDVFGLDEVAPPIASGDAASTKA
jgi:hypothetical protein